MIQFADEAVIEVRSGKGGNGCIAFRREKFVPNGGPAGGDGGRGGDVVFCVKRNLRTLAHLRRRQVFKAQNGSDGQGRGRYGSDGEDVVIALPPGSRVSDALTGAHVCEFTDENEGERFVYLKGGNGGWGNIHFKSSVNQAPRYAHEGKGGEVKKLRVELSIMADIGLVGFPNAGKSSLLDYFTNARPKIAPYPFTTKIPNLGVLRIDDEQDIVIADIPGIIEGASGGAGLGIRFLKHISRTAGLAFIIDCSDDTYADAYEKLNGELSAFSSDLASKKRIILCNKIDVSGAAVRAAELAQKYKDIVTVPFSIHTREGLERVKKELISLVYGGADGYAGGGIAGDFSHAAFAGSFAGGFAGSQSTGGTASGSERISDFLASRSCVDNEQDVQYPGTEQ
ncbi:MAG: GTPase ObgE [Treponema lecithinolyticum]|uniref:GTPase ObgE n=1 Tax=Treponema lecithinolyticum TaxID=53418 RepID=UPI003613A838